MSILEALEILRTRYDVVELCYHTDGDPGDGSGWVLVLGERSVAFGLLADVVKVATDRAALPEAS